jgi:RNase H-fold protein (predicted Holliday junction resolvase)
VPVESYDERLTTRMAQASQRSGAQAGEDSLAAAHLLEGYLAKKESDSQSGREA